MAKPIVFQDASVSVDVWHGTLRVQCGKFDKTMQPEEFAELVYPSIKAAAEQLEAPVAPATS
jgi:hypothetical protein